MRIATPECLSDQWFANIFFREVGRPMPMRIGNSIVQVGKGREAYGNLAMVQIEMSKDRGDIHLLPGMRVLSVVVAPSAKIPPKYLEMLSPADEVELIRPSAVVTVDDLKLAEEITAVGEDRVKQELQVLQGTRGRFLHG